MKIKLSKSKWNEIGKKAGWISANRYKTASQMPDFYQISKDIKNVIVSQPDKLLKDYLKECQNELSIAISNQEVFDSEPFGVYTDVNTIEEHLNVVQLLLDNFNRAKMKDIDSGLIEKAVSMVKQKYFAKNNVIQD